MEKYYKKLNELIGDEAFNMLKDKKAYLNVWKQTSPSNYYITPIDNEHDYIWHSTNNNWLDIMCLIGKCFDRVSLSSNNVIYQFKM